jgi:hypothetical protein
MKPRGVGINDKTGDAIATLVLAGPCENKSKIGAVSAADPQFSAVDDPVITNPNGFGLDGSGGV